MVMWFLVNAKELMNSWQLSFLLRPFPTSLYAADAHFFALIIKDLNVLYIWHNHIMAVIEAGYYSLCSIRECWRVIWLHPNHHWPLFSSASYIRLLLIFCVLLKSAGELFESILTIIGCFSRLFLASDCRLLCLIVNCGDTLFCWRSVFIQATT